MGALQELPWMFSDPKSLLDQSNIFTMREGKRMRENDIEVSIPPELSYSMYLLLLAFMKRFTLPHIHPFIRTQTAVSIYKETHSSSGAVRVRCLVQGHLNTSTFRQSQGYKPATLCVPDNCCTS